MPELPEVETVVRDLRGPLVGRTIRKLEVGPKTLRRPWKSPSLVGRSIVAVERRGKWIRIDLGGPCLLVHLGMTGQFTAVDADEPRQDHTHFVFTLKPDNLELRFRDVRRFGSVSWYPSVKDLEAFFVRQKLGP